MPKWLKLLVIAILIVVTGLFLWDVLVRQPRQEQEIKTIRQEAQESTAVWQARLDTLGRRSTQRDAIVDSAAVQEQAQEIASDLLSDQIANLRNQLRSIPEVRDSNTILVQLNAQQESRHTADTIRIARLRVQRDTLRQDRDDWKEAAGRLHALNLKLARDIDRLADIKLNECSYGIVKLPCPTIVGGPSVGIDAKGTVHAGLAITGGIPLRFGRRARPAPQRTAVVLPGPLSASDTAVVSDLERE